VVDRLIAGEAPLRVLREHRGLTQGRLAEACGVSKAHVAQLESAPARHRCGCCSGWRQRWARRWRI